MDGSPRAAAAAAATAQVGPEARQVLGGNSSGSGCSGSAPLGWKPSFVS